MLDVIHSWILAISGVLYQPWFVPVFLIVGGLYFTFRCKFIQVRPVSYTHLTLPTN